MVGVFLFLFWFWPFVLFCFGCFAVLFSPCPKGCIYALIVQYSSRGN